MTLTITAAHEVTWLKRATFAAIVANAGIIAWSWFAEESEFLEKLDVGLLLFFVVELVVRIKNAGRGALRDGWLIFDVVVIALALAPLGANLTALRVTRAARLGHFGKHVPHLRHLTALRSVSLLAQRTSLRQLRLLTVR